MFFWYFGSKILEIVEIAYNWSSGRFNTLDCGRIGGSIHKELSCIWTNSDIEDGRICCRLLIKLSKILLN